MMNELIIEVEKSTRMITLPKSILGNDMENLQEKLIFKFTDEFVDGQARLEYKIGTIRNYVILEKYEDQYNLPIKNVITKEGRIEMQLVITQGTSEEEIPVFKSNVFYLYCNKSINAVDEAPEGYELWIEQANAKLNQVDEALQEIDNIDITSQRVEDGVEISITNKEGETTKTVLKDGKRGKDGDSGIVTFEIQNGHLIATSTNTQDLNNYSVQNGHLYLRIGE